MARPGHPTGCPGLFRACCRRCAMQLRLAPRVCRMVGSLAALHCHILPAARPALCPAPNTLGCVTPRLLDRSIQVKLRSGPPPPYGPSRVFSLWPRPSSHRTWRGHSLCPTPNAQDRPGFASCAGAQYRAIGLLLAGGPRPSGPDRSGISGVRGNGVPGSSLLWHDTRGGIRCLSHAGYVPSGSCAGFRVVPS